MANAANRVMAQHFWGNEMLCHSLGSAGQEKVENGKGRIARGNGK
jgi:hypothetical protein